VDVVKKFETRFVEVKEMPMRRYSILSRAGFATLLTLACATAAFAEDFRLQVGPPTAGNAQQSKSSMFVVRPGGCADPAAAKLTGTREGIVDGVRRSVPLTLVALPTPGVYAVPRDWDSAGAWVVSLVGTCAGKTAGAIVSIGPRDTYRRESVRLLAHRATPAEIDESLKAAAAGGAR
jgi:hypothetical protein